MDKTLVNHFRQIQSSTSRIMQIAQKECDVWSNVLEFKKQAEQTEDLRKINNYVKRLFGIQNAISSAQDTITIMGSWITMNRIIDHERSDSSLFKHILESVHSSIIKNAQSLLDEYFSENAPRHSIEDGTGWSERSKKLRSDQLRNAISALEPKLQAPSIG